jgi:hypothetical protein
MDETMGGTGERNAGRESPRTGLPNRPLLLQEISGLVPEHAELARGVRSAKRSC